MSKIIDGKAVSAQVKQRIKAETDKLREQGIEIGLAVVIVGDDPASKVYVRNKKRACEEVGFNSYEYALPAETTEEELLDLVRKLNADDKVDGILVQLPLPKHLDDKVIINNILPEKDVDAFHPVNVLQLSAVYAGRRYGAHRLNGHRDTGQGVRRYRQEQHRRQAAGNAAAA